MTMHPASKPASAAVAAQAVNQGTPAPAHSPGVLDLSNGLVSGSNTVLQIALGGQTAGVGSGFHDQLIVLGGGVSLDGQLQASLRDGFVPQEGDVFTFLGSGRSIAVAGQTHPFGDLEAGHQALALSGASNAWHCKAHQRPGGAPA